MLAHVNSEDVTKADFERLLRNIELNNRGPVPADRRDEIYRKVLDELVNYTLLKQEAKARNFTATDAEVETQMQSMRQAARSEEAFNKALAERKMTLEKLKADAKVEIAIAKMMNAQVATLTEATDAEAKDFYDKNPDKFKRPETVRASHILLRVDPNADDATKKQTRAKIDEVLKQAKSGTDFAALAKQNSQDGSAAARRRPRLLPERENGSGVRRRRLRAQDWRHQRCRDDAVRPAYHQGDRSQASRDSCRSTKSAPRSRSSSTSRRSSNWRRRSSRKSGRRPKSRS